MKKILIIAIAALSFMGCEKEEIKVNESSEFLRVKNSNCLTCNDWRLVYTYKNSTSQIGDSSVWKFGRSTVQINNAKEGYINIGAYLSVGGEYRFKSTIIKLDFNNMELLKTDSTVMVFDKI
jgi:hypothetical protein